MLGPLSLYLYRRREAFEGGPVWQVMIPQLRTDRTPDAVRSRDCSLQQHRSQRHSEEMDEMKGIECKLKCYKSIC